MRRCRKTSRRRVADSISHNGRIARDRTGDFYVIKLLGEPSRSPIKPAVQFAQLCTDEKTIMRRCTASFATSYNFGWLSLSADTHGPCIHGAIYCSRPLALTVPYAGGHAKLRLDGAAKLP